MQSYGAVRTERTAKDLKTLTSSGLIVDFRLFLSANWGAVAELVCGVCSAVHCLLEFLRIGRPYPIEINKRTGAITRCLHFHPQN